MERECSLLLLSKKPEPSDRFRILPVACGVLFHDWVGERTDFQRGIQMPRRFSYDYPAWSESVLFYCSAKSQSLLTGSVFCLSLAACFSTIGLGGAQISRGAFRCRRRFSYDYPAWSESVLFYCLAENSTGRKASCGRRLSSAASAAAKAAANKTAAAAACMDGFRRR
jgi:hypothetical protein